LLLAKILAPVPLILLGNGIGAFVVREFTVGNIDRIRKYPYLKNGAMYSILALGLIMVLDSFGVHIPSWVSPVITFAVIGFFFWKSVRAARSSSGRNFRPGHSLMMVRLFMTDSVCQEATTPHYSAGHTPNQRMISLTFTWPTGTFFTPPTVTMVYSCVVLPMTAPVNRPPAAKVSTASRDRSIGKRCVTIPSVFTLPLPMSAAAISNGVFFPSSVAWQLCR
jgi:hypothetical protein